jgi:(S)-ureidoglycine aminohydrolase
MQQNEKATARARVDSGYALMPLDGFPPSRLPRWRACHARVLAGPTLGAGFVQMHLTLDAGGGVNQSGDDCTQTFLYILGGGVELTVGGHRVIVGAGGFAYIPHASDYELRAPVASTLLLLRKIYYPLAGVIRPEPITGNISNIPAEPWMDNPRTRVQRLLPDEFSYDFEMSLFTFEAGFGSPGVSTHVMEHGVFIVEGAGQAFLAREMHDLYPGDFLWIGSYCPHQLTAAGSPLKLLTFTNVNRDIVPDRRAPKL